MRLGVAFAALAAAVVVIGGATAAGVAGVRVNTTRSMPRGLWIEYGGPPVRGAVVTACVPDAALAARLGRAAVLGPGRCPGAVRPLMKPIAAVAGDIVTVAPSGLTVNGLPIPRTRPAPWARNFGALPHAPYGRHRVAAGEVWLVANRVPGSIDSRYFGPVPLAAAGAPLRPWWLWDSPTPDEAR